MKYQFYALLEKEDEYYTVEFPDLGGVNTFGDNKDAAIAMATDALGGHLLVMEDDGDKIPSSSSFYELNNNLKDNQLLKIIIIDTDILRNPHNS